MKIDGARNHLLPEERKKFDGKPRSDLTYLLENFDRRDSGIKVIPFGEINDVGKQINFETGYQISPQVVETFGLQTDSNGNPLQYKVIYIDDRQGLSVFFTGFSSHTAEFTPTQALTTVEIKMAYDKADYPNAAVFESIRFAGIHPQLKRVIGASYRIFPKYHGDVERFGIAITREEAKTLNVHHRNMLPTQAENPYWTSGFITQKMLDEAHAGSHAEAVGAYLTGHPNERLYLDDAIKNLFQLKSDRNYVFLQGSTALNLSVPFPKTISQLR